MSGEIDFLVPDNQRQHNQKNLLPYAVCSLPCPVSAALASIFQVNSIFTSYMLS